MTNTAGVPEATYACDGAGRRVRETTGGAALDLCYDAAWRVSEF